MIKKGSKVRYIGEETLAYEYGKIYEVYGYSEEFEAYGVMSELDEVFCVAGAALQEVTEINPERYDETEIPEVTKIYFDMDSVLADFERGVRQICEMEPPTQNGTPDPERDDEMWRRIKEAEHFYDQLELMAGAKELFDAVYNKYGDKCEILTGVPKPKRGIITAGEDKINWVRRLLSKDIKVNIVLREEKKNYCTGKGCILIDDMEKNILEWKEMGGSGFMNVDAQDTLNRLQGLGIV